ncbi:hypothetical protein E4U53_006207 [Claviceps sorghi]|nr:hypothetical protein E4U53_006207 [Claviceps sorghi]
MDSAAFREAAMAAIDDAADYQQHVSSKRVVSAVQPGYLASLLPSSAPLDPEPFSAIRADLHDKIMPGMTHWASPRFMAFFPCLASYPAVVAEIYTNAMNGAYFNWICSPAATELEVIVMDWMAGALGLPECYTSRGPTRGGGVLHGSASEAVLTVMAAAREQYVAARTRHLPDGPAKEDETWRLRSRLVAVASTGTHSSTRKAARILGVRFDAVPVGAADGFALRGGPLAARLAQLAARGLEPFFLTATLGTTDVCAVDDLEGIADALRRGHPDVFVHVDAAHAGSALLLPEFRHLAAPLAHFHSFNFNPHKWLLTGYDCSATFVRSRAHLTDALSVDGAPYLRNHASDAGLVTDYRDWQIALGKRFRSLKLWFVLRSYGIRGLQAHLRSGIAMAHALERRLATRPDLFTLFTPARFALVTLRVAAPDEHRADARTRRVYDAVLARAEYFLTSTLVHGRTVIRVCTAVTGVREEHVDGVFRVLVREAERECLGGVAPPRDAATTPDACPVFDEKSLESLDEKSLESRVLEVSVADVASA